MKILIVPYVFLSIKLLLTDTSISGGLDTVGEEACNRILVAAYIYIYNQKGTEESNPTSGGSGFRLSHRLADRPPKETESKRRDR